MKRSKLPHFFLGLAAVLAVAALALLILRPGVPGNFHPVGETPHVNAPPAVPPPDVNAPPADEKPDAGLPPPPIRKPIDKPVVPEDPATALKNLGGGVATDTPADLVQQIAKALEAGDLATLGRLIGKDALDPETVERLKTLTAKGLRLRPQTGVREVGELELNTRSRWALELDDTQPGHDKIFLDLQRDGQKWSVGKITLPPAPGEQIPKMVLTDSLGVADTFLQAILKQNFELARTFVDAVTVSDAKIAGLCILFEEGGYRLRSSKPLRTMFQRPDAVGFLTHVETSDGSQSAQFSLTLTQAPTPANWRVAEINLDQLLADYARRVAGGDVYYSPLVKNPAGGDTLALYFEFDQDAINPRTCRQLEIVSRILMADPGKKLTLSGHTDALGTDDYNHSLSSRRADVVRDFLIRAGVVASQIVTVAKGSSQPRRPNITPTGDDNPEGRRANRRTEIYLDF
jgi:outer membrane protein OmpA-like peptidoglycan-associated protein